MYSTLTVKSIRYSIIENKRGLSYSLKTFTKI